MTRDVVSLALVDGEILCSAETGGNHTGAGTVREWIAIRTLNPTGHHASYHILILYHK